MLENEFGQAGRPCLCLFSLPNWDENSNLPPTFIPEPQGDNGWESALRGRAGTVLLMDMLDKARARCTLGQYASSSLLVILLS